MEKKVIHYVTMRFVIPLLALLLFCVSVGKGAYLLQGGFTIRHITPLSVPAKRNWNPEIDQILLQPFRYFSRGRQSFVFLSEDGNYVLKIPRTDVYKLSFFQRAIKSSVFQKQLADKLANRREKFSESLRLSQEELQAQTKVLATHFGCSEPSTQNILLIDRLGFKKTLPLHSTSFVLQEKLSLLTPALLASIERKQTEEAKKILDALIEVIGVRAKKQIMDRDQTFLGNYGFDGETAYLLDVGSFYFHPADDTSHKSLRDSMGPFSDWLATIDPALHQYLNQRLSFLLGPSD